MQETAGQATGTRWWCKRCEEPVTRTGLRAEHAATGSAACADGESLAVPDRTDPAKRRDARQIMAEFPGWRVSLPFGGRFFRADWDDPPPGVTVPHREDDTADGLRRKLAAATVRATLPGAAGARTAGA